PGAAVGATYALDGPRAPRAEHRLARAAAAPGKPRAHAAAAGRIAAPGRDLAQRRARGLPRRHARLDDHIPADLFGGVAWSLAEGARTADAAAYRRHRHRLDCHRTDHDAHWAHHDLSDLGPPCRHGQSRSVCVVGVAAPNRVSAVDLRLERAVHGHG